MRIGGIDFPPEVWDAHQEGKLVIFAGAGVSMDPPSNYPDFENLVRQVAEGTLHKLESEEKRLDLFLGRMEHDGVKVHEQVKEVLTNPDSQPNHFHDSIVRLFKDSNNLRIITTNFDQHFTTVIRDTGFPVDIYKAPALPVGSRFQGLVYLHGCVDSPADRLVLTDSDFGRAYMTEGWALRFLLGVYTSFTVLFIGYSHDDLVLTYLTRGLSPETARLYALTPKDKSLDKWRFLGIEPVLYQLQDEENNHVALREAVLRWAEITLMGALDHEALIRQSLNAGPPLRETEEDDYLQDVVQDPVRIRFFIRHANRTEWHLWAEERGLLSPLFSQEIESNEMIGYLADWFASELVAKEPGIALGIFERQGQTMSISLWWAIALLFHRADSIHKDALPKWLPLLIQHHKPGVKVDVLEYLFDKCTAAEECSLALLLFQFLTRPIIRLEKSFMLEDRDAEQASSAIDILGSHHWIHDALEKCFKPNIAEVSRDLARISSHQIRIAFELGRCHRIAHHEWDGLSYRRSAIEPHEQDEHPRDFDAVIDSCRDSLEWLLDHDYTCGRILINEWIESPAPLLRRLAVHGTTEDTGMSADDKLRWVLEHELVGSLIIHHEIYRLLEKVYPETSGALRRALIEQARHSTESKISANPDADPDIYRHGLFVLITWLDDAAGGSCPIVQDQLEIIKKEHPQWKVSEHPDFTSWMSSGWGNESPICAEELRRISVTETISLLHSYKEDDVLGPSRDGLLEQFAVAVKEDPGWGLRITRKLAETSEEAVDVWDRLFWALSDASLADKQWQELLTLIDNNEEFLEHDISLARVLTQGMRKNENSLPYPLLPLAEKIACRLWEIAARKDNTSAALTGNWLTKAINHTGGVLAEFFLHAISSRKKHEEPRTEGIPIDLREQLDRIIEGENIASIMGRVVLASKLHFLFSIDPQWTTENMIPLFDWDRDELQAVQTWHGFLAWGRWFDDLLHHLLPLYKQCFNRLDSDLNDMRDRFTNHVANICIFSSLKETRSDWLNQFLAIADNVSRKEFASAIGHSLWNMEDDRVETIWKDWLFGYWENRLIGKPVPLDRDEMAEMVQWSPHLKPVFPSVVEIICRNEQDLPIDDFVLHKLLENKIPEAFPKETSRLLLYIASYSKSRYFLKFDEIIENLLHYNEAHSDLKDTLDVLAEKGFQKAAEYRRRLEAMDEES